MKIKYLIGLVVALLYLQVVPVMAQSVNVSLVVKPPYSSYLDDYRQLDNKAIITVTNLTHTAQQVYFKGSIVNESLGLYIRSGANYRPSTPLILQPNQTRVLTSDANSMRFLAEGSASTNASDKVKQNIIHTGQLPEGIYRLCVQAFDYNSGHPLSDENSGCATINISLAGPPQITFPFNGHDIEETQKNLNFSWTPPVGNLAGAKMEYELVVAKILPGQNPNDAIKAARDYDAGNPLVHRKGLKIQAYVTQVSDFKPEPGTKYAVQVVARDAGHKLVFGNEGRSEIVVFNYRRKKIADKDKDDDRKTTVPKATIPKMDMYKITGRLVWSFRQTEESMTPITAISQTPPDINNTGFDDIAGSKFLGGGGKSSGTSGGKSSGTGAAMGGKAGVMDYGEGSTKGFYGSGAGNKKPDVGGLYATNPIEAEAVKKQTLLNQLAGKDKYSLAFTKVKLYKRLDPQLPKKAKKQETDVFIATTTTDAKGNFTFIVPQELGNGYMFQIEVDKSNFEFAGTTIPVTIKPNQPYDMGEILGIAATYRLKINVQDQKSNNLPDAQVYIFRAGNFYNSPKEHVNLVRELWQEADENGNRKNKSGGGVKVPSLYDTAAMGKAGNSYGKAFFNTGYADRYIVYITGSGFEDYMSDIVLINEDELSADVLTIEKTYKLKLANPVLKGRVVACKTDMPLKGATVVLHPKDMDAEQAIAKQVAKTTKTDAGGKFRIENIPVNVSQKYNVSVIYKGLTHPATKDMVFDMKGQVINYDPIVVDIALMTVCGGVVTKDDYPVSNVALHWKQGGDVFYTDEGGLFFGMQEPGKHTLIAEKKGYKTTEMVIEVKPPNYNIYIQSATQDPEKGYGYYNDVVTKQKALNAGVTMGSQQSNANTNANTNVDINISANPNINNAGIYKNGVTYNKAVFYELAKSGSLYSNIAMCGNKMVLRGFTVDVTVKDEATGKTIQGAKLMSQVVGHTVTTDAGGHAILEDLPSGQSYIITKGPDNTFYTTSMNSVEVKENKDKTSITVSLKPGSRVKGNVSLASKPLAGAEIYVAGKEYIKAESDKSGNYVLNGVPAGAEYTIKASKEGLVSATETKTFAANQTYDINFVLKDPGFNATNLLGFKMELDESKPGANANEFIISGRLVDLPDNDVFKKEKAYSDIKLSFVNDTIVKVGNTIRPKNDQMVLTPVEIPVTIFSDLHATLGAGLKLRASAADKAKGEIAGAVTIKLKNSFAALSGWNMPADAMKLTVDGKTDVAVISSTAKSSVNSFGLSGNSNGWQLYEFKFIPELKSSSLTTDGLKLKGNVYLTGIPSVNDITIKIASLTISKGGEAKDVKLSDEMPSIKLANKWSLDLSKISLNEYGIEVTGDLDLPVPDSKVSSLGFTKLGISKNGLTGGSFVLPEGGIDIFGAVNFHSANPFSIESLPGGTGFRVTGGGTIKLPKYITDDIEMDKFSFATNGDFSVSSSKGATMGFGDGLADVTINNVTLGSKLVDLDASFTLAIPSFGAAIGSHIKYSNGNVDIDKLHIGFDLAQALSLSADLAFINDGFAGEGALSVMNTNGIKLGFHYYSVPGGKSIGAQFTAPNTFIVPIGLAKWDLITGGFDVNTGTQIYSINGGGRFSFVADAVGLLALTDAKITITSTPDGLILAGNTNATVMDSWNIGTASLTLDFGKKTFNCTGKFGTSFNFIQGIGIDQSASVTIAASAGDDKYIYAAGNTNANIAYVFNTGTSIGAGWNAPKYLDPHPEMIPAEALDNSGKIYGGYFHAFSKIGLTKDEALSIGYKGIADLKMWCSNSSDVAVYGNVKTNTYGFSYGQHWEAGAEADFLDLPVAGADITLGGDLVAAYVNGSWSIKGKAAGSLNAHVGCDGGCNGITWGGCFHIPWPIDEDVCPIPCGGKVCADASMTITYSSAGGFTFDPDFF